jgi:hypothetical protein
MRAAIITLTVATLLCGCGNTTADYSQNAGGVSQANAQKALYNAGYRNVALAPDGNGGWTGTAESMAVGVDATGHIQHP